MYSLVKSGLLSSKGNKILLGMKKRGFGEGKWNGFGGKLEAGETIEQAAIRELEEESGISVSTIEKIGILEFYFDGKDDFLETHIYIGKDISGTPVESEEMRPQWFDIDEIPFHSMWDDDSHWFPIFLKEEIFNGKFFFNDNNIMHSYHLERDNERKK
jgi:8-oxo-dGTP diphosphatase/2-hydroxy-dATP diphosphatase